MSTEPKTWDEALDMIFAEMRSIMIERQAKYGPENIREQGLYGVITRASADKVARIQRAMNGKVVNGKVELDPIGPGTEAADTFEDGLLDAANYFGPIALMVHRGWWDLPRAADVPLYVTTMEDGSILPGEGSAYLHGWWKVR